MVAGGSQNSYELETAHFFGQIDSCRERLSDFYTLVANDDIRSKPSNKPLSNPNI